MQSFGELLQMHEAFNQHKIKMCLIPMLLKASLKRLFLYLNFLRGALQNSAKILTMSM